MMRSISSVILFVDFRTYFDRPTWSFFLLDGCSSPIPRLGATWIWLSRKGYSLRCHGQRENQPITTGLRCFCVNRLFLTATVKNTGKVAIAPSPERNNSGLVLAQHTQLNPRCCAIPFFYDRVTVICRALSSFRGWSVFCAVGPSTYLRSSVNLAQIRLSNRCVTSLLRSTRLP